jgi:hypothetical protein
MSDQLEGERPADGGRAPRAEHRLAKHIVVDRDENGAPRITIDGEQLPWFTQGIVTPAPSLREMPTVTITLLAEKVEMLNAEHLGRWLPSADPNQ